MAVRPSATSRLHRALPSVADAHSRTCSGPGCRPPSADRGHPAEAASGSRLAGGTFMAGPSERDQQAPPAPPAWPTPRATSGCPRCPARQAPSCRRSGRRCGRRRRRSSARGGRPRHRTRTTRRRSRSSTSRRSARPARAGRSGPDPDLPRHVRAALGGRAPVDTGPGLVVGPGGSRSRRPAEAPARRAVPAVAVGRPDARADPGHRRHGCVAAPAHAGLTGTAPGRPRRRPTTVDGSTADRQPDGAPVAAPVNDRPDRQARPRPPRQGRQPLQATGLRLPVGGDLRRYALRLGLRAAGRRAQGEHQAAVVADRRPEPGRHRRPGLLGDPAAPDLGGLRPRRRLHRPADRVPELPQALPGRPPRGGVRGPQGPARRRTAWPTSAARTAARRARGPSRATST